MFKKDHTYDMRDGRRGTVVAELNGSELLVIYRNEGCNDTYGLHRSDGKFGIAGDSGNSPNDLMPPMRTVWVNFYDYNCNLTSICHWHTTEEAARERVGVSCIAIAIPVEIPDA